MWSASIHPHSQFFMAWRIVKHRHTFIFVLYFPVLCILCFKPQVLYEGLDFAQVYLLYYNLNTIQKMRVLSISFCHWQMSIYRVWRAIYRVAYFAGTKQNKLQECEIVFTLRTQSWDPHTYDFVVPVSLTYKRKYVLVGLQITNKWNRKIQRLIICPTWIYIQETLSVALSPRANYTDWATVQEINKNYNCIFLSCKYWFKGREFLLENS
jgi:hypothetical protein